MTFLPKITPLLFCIMLHSLTAFAEEVAEDVIVKKIMPPQTGRLSTPADRDKFAREHPRPPTSGQNPIPFRPAEGAEKYKADKEAAEAVSKKREHSRHQNTRLHDVNKKNKTEKEDRKENDGEKEDTAPESESAAAAKANALKN